MKRHATWRKTSSDDPMLSVFTPVDAEDIRRRAADAGMTPEEFVIRRLLLPCFTERNEGEAGESE